MDVWPSYADEGKDELSVRNTNKLYYYITNSAVVKRKMQKENEIAYKIKKWAGYAGERWTLTRWNDIMEPERMKDHAVMGVIA